MLGSNECCRGLRARPPSCLKLKIKVVALNLEDCGLRVVLLLIALCFAKRGALLLAEHCALLLAEHCALRFAHALGAGFWGGGAGTLMAILAFWDSKACVGLVRARLLPSCGLR